MRRGVSAQASGAVHAPLIEPEELEQCLTEPTTCVVDCRFALADPDAGRRAYAAGHIPGAVYADLERDLSGEVVRGRTGRHPLPEPEAFAAVAGRWGIDGSTQVVAYDADSGAFAARLWWILKWLGHAKVAVLNGGFKAWQAAGFGVSSKPTMRPPTVFSAHPQPDLLATADDVERVRQDPQWRLFDARANDRFRGAQEPIDPVAGHIPGARSFPFGENLDGSRLQASPALAARFRERLGPVPTDHAVAYCGSGVTACHLVLAAAAAGFPYMRLYAGSWSEWITDPRRPVARED